jgi:hypothetical protein
MTDIPQDNKNFLHHPNIDEYIFIGLIAASFIGEVMMKVSMLFGFFYWMAITPIFFTASIISEKANNIRTGRETRFLIKYQMFYWGSAFVAVILVFLLWDLDRIGPSEASIIIHIILAHTMFLSGIVLGLRYYLIGMFLFATASLSILTDFTLSFSLDLVLIVSTIWLGLKVKNQLVLPILKRESDFIKSDNNYSGEERRG